MLYVMCVVCDVCTRGECVFAQAALVTQPFMNELNWRTQMVCVLGWWLLAKCPFVRKMGQLAAKRFLFMAFV